MPLLSLGPVAQSLEQGARKAVESGDAARIAAEAVKQAREQQCGEISDREREHLAGILASKAVEA
jgi:hypothetical protein